MIPIVALLVWARVLLSLAPPPPRLPADSGDAARTEREEMVALQLAGRDITDARVLRAMAEVPRERFVPPPLAGRAYEDGPLPIGSGQTISQPYIVALMTQLLKLPPSGARVLEVGTGSGYQAAVLAALGAEVYSVEIIPALADEAAARLREMGCANVHVKAGDGYQGWREHAPFDGIIVTAAATHIPPPLVEQLREGGRMVIPLGGRIFGQELVVAEKRNGKITEKRVIPVSFVPLTGGHERR